MVEGFINNSSFLLQAFGAFAAGLLTLLTPCVYPLIPITLSVCGARAAQTRKEAFLASLTYCLGLCACYTLIGFIAIKTGALFGSFLSYPLVRFSLSLLLISLALNSLEIISFTFLAKLQNWASRFSAKGYSGTFIMGALSGFVAAPCVGPVLVLILTVAASVENQSLGVLLLFIYSVGMSLPFLILGTFASLLTKLPRSGEWLHVIKFITAAALLVVVGFLNQDYFHPLLILYSMPLSIFGLFIISLYLGRLSYQYNLKSIRVLSVLILYCSIYPLAFGTPASSTVGIDSSSPHWLSSIDEAIKDNPHKLPIMVDFYADWCAACVEFDTKTFPDSDVRKELTNFKTVRIDFTSIDEEKNALSERYKITGLPSIIFLNHAGIEFSQERITGFLDPKRFKDHLVKITKTTSNIKQPEATNSLPTKQ